MLFVDKPDLSLNLSFMHTLNLCLFSLPPNHAQLQTAL